MLDPNMDIIMQGFIQEAYMENVKILYIIKNISLIFQLNMLYEIHLEIKEKNVPPTLKGMYKRSEGKYRIISHLSKIRKFPSSK